MKQAIVVGSTSMLGERLVELLASSDVSIFSCGRDPKHDVVVDLGGDRGITIPGTIKADVLFNCAASFEDDSDDGRWLNEKVNALGSYQVAEVARRTGCKSVVHAGSIFSYSLKSRATLTSYGASKARGEEILDWALNRDSIIFTSLRLPQLYDERGRSCKHQPWFGRIVAYASLGRVLRLPEGSAERNFLHVLDAVRLMFTAGERALQGIFPACNPASESYESIARTAFEVFGMGGGVEIAAEKEPFRDVYNPISEHTYAVFGVSPKISMREGLLLIKDSGSACRYGPIDVE